MADQYQEGAIAEGPNGQFLVMRGGNWYPSNDKGVPTQRIPRSDYGERYFQQPNGDIVREGPRGGFEVIERAGDTPGGGDVTVGADARGRYNIGIDSMIAAEKQTSKQEARGGNPLARDWGAWALDRVAFDGPGDNDIRPFSGLAAFWGGQDYQDYNQALASYEASLMPIMSGASVTASEARRMIRADFPAIGDTEETIANKARNRLRRINAVAQGLGRDAIFSDEEIAAARGRQDDLPKYAGVAAAAQGVTGGYDIGPDGRPIAPVDGPQPGDVVTTSQPLAPEDTPNSLSAQGYVYDPGSDTWKRSRQEQAWTPAGAVSERRDMNGLLRRVDAFGRGAADVASFGGADEVAAGADALIGRGNGYNLGSRYSSNVNTQRAIDEADQQDVPVTRIAGQVAGGLAAFPSLAARGGATLVGNALRGAGVGAAFGGAYGFGSGEGGAGMRGRNALTGAAIGGATGGIAPAVIAGGQRVLSPAVNALQDAGRFLGRQVVNRIPNAPQRLQEAVQPNALRRGLERFAGTNHPNINALQTERTRLEASVGRPVAAADVVNTGGRGLLRGTAMRSDAARQRAEDFATGRAEALPQRISQQTRRIVSSDQRSPDDIRSAIRTERDGLAREQYAQPYAQPVEVGSEIGAALSGAPGRSAIQRARAAAEAWQDDSAVAELDALYAATQTGDALPAVSAGTVDRLRQALSGRGEQLAQRPGTRAVGAGIQRRAAQVDSALDDVEGLAAARGSYRDMSRQIDAVDAGERFLGNPDDVIGAMQGAPASAQAPFRAAAARTIERAAGTTSAAPGVANRLAVPGTPTRQVMDATLGADDAESLAQAMRGERDLLRRAQRIDPANGSSTAQNGVDFARAAGIGADVMSGRFGAAGMKIVDAVRARGFNDAQAEAVIDAMTDPSRTQEVIDILAQRMSRREARNLTRSIRYQVTTSLQSGQQN